MALCTCTSSCMHVFPDKNKGVICLIHPAGVRKITVFSEAMNWGNAEQIAHDFFFLQEEAVREAQEGDISHSIANDNRLIVRSSVAFFFGGAWGRCHTHVHDLRELCALMLRCPEVDKTTFFAFRGLSMRSLEGMESYWLSVVRASVQRAKRAIGSLELCVRRGKYLIPPEILQEICKKVTIYDFL